MDQEREREALLDPRGRSGGEENERLAPRPGSLSGLRLGLLNNTKPNSAVLLEQLGEILRDEHGVAGVTLLAKPSFAVPAEEALLARIGEECDVVLAGVGD